MPEPIPLEYAPDLRRRQWRKWIVRSMLALALITPFVAGFLHRDEISLRVRRWYWARQCLAHVTPPGTVLLEWDRAKVAGNPEYMTDADPSDFSPSRYVSTPPGLRLPNPPAGYMPQVWREYARLESRSIEFDPAPRAPSPIVFLGQRHTPAGKPRLVVISAGVVNAMNMEQSISRLVLSVPGLLDAPVQSSGSVDVIDPASRYIPTFLQPGVADPNDPTHLTIDFEIQARSTDQPARKGTLDVFLEDNDVLTIKLRDPAILKGL